MKPLTIMLASVLIGLSYIGDAHAYLDPGTGSIILQGMIAIIAGAAVTLKLYWARVRGYFDRQKAEPDSTRDD